MPTNSKWKYSKKRQSEILRYAAEHSVAAATRKFKVSDSTIFNWRKQIREARATQTPVVTLAAKSRVKKAVAMPSTANNNTVTVNGMRDVVATLKIIRDEAQQNLDAAVRILNFMERKQK